MTTACTIIVVYEYKYIISVYEDILIVQLFAVHSPGCILKQTMYLSMSDLTPMQSGQYTGLERRGILYCTIMSHISCTLCFSCCILYKVLHVATAWGLVYTQGYVYSVHLCTFVLGEKEFDTHYFRFQGILIGMHSIIRTTGS